MENQKEKFNPFLIISITVICVLFLVFLIMYFDWLRDKEPYMPLRPVF